MNENTTLTFEDAHRQSDCNLPPETLAIHPWVSDAKDISSLLGLENALSDGDVRDRAVERILTGVNTGSIAEPRNTTLETEFLSYPVARIILSVLDERRVIARYVAAETDYSVGVLEPNLWHPSEDLDALALFEEFGFDVEETTVYDVLTEERKQYASAEACQQSLYRLPFYEYLRVSTEMDDEWGLVNMGLEDGYVTIPKDDVVTFLRAAIEQRIGESLPFDVSDEIENQVDEDVERVSEGVDKDLFTREIDRVEEGLFPPVIKQMLEDFPHNLTHEQKHTLAAFFLNIGMEPDEVLESLGVVGTPGEDPTRYQVKHIYQDDDPYMPANYDTLKSWGYEWEMDELEQKVKNPLSYYRIKLDENSNSGAFRWLDVYDDDVASMLTYPAGPVSLEIDDEDLPDGFKMSENGAEWTCDALGHQCATGLALVAVAEGYVDANDLSMTFLKDMDPMDAVEICTTAVSKYDFTRTPPTYILEVIGDVYGFEFVKESVTALKGSWLSKRGKRDAQEAFESLASTKKMQAFWSRINDDRK